MKQHDKGKVCCEPGDQQHEPPESGAHGSHRAIQSETAASTAKSADREAICSRKMNRVSISTPVFRGKAVCAVLNQVWRVKPLGSSVLNQKRYGIAACWLLMVNSGHDQARSIQPFRWHSSSAGESHRRRKERHFPVARAARPGTHGPRCRCRCAPGSAAATGQVRAVPALTAPTPAPVAFPLICGSSTRRQAASNGAFVGLHPANSWPGFFEHEQNHRNAPME